MTTLRAEFRWEQADATSAVDGEAATWGYLGVRLGPRLFWGGTNDSGDLGVLWTWIELLEYLAASWPWLVGEQGWPPNLLSLDLNPREFESERRRVLQEQGDARAAVDATLFNFRERHDLSVGVHGKRLPRLWVVRQGNHAWVGAASSALIAWHEVEQFLTMLGDEIAERLSPHCDERSQQALSRWQERACVDPILRAEAMTGLDTVAIRALLGEQDPAAALELPATGFESTELSFAARLAAPSLSTQTTQRLLTLIRQTPAEVHPPDMSDLVKEAMSHISGSDYAYEQGLSLAEWLRRRLQLDPDDRVDPVQLLSDWNVTITDVDLDDQDVDAVACWGRRHGPAVYVNKSGRRAQRPAGRRATIAHELLHVLVDRESALPLSEIQGSVHRSWVEQRANAFAAEFLIPRVVAGSAFGACESTSEAARGTLAKLGKQYGASREIIAWQALNSGVSLSSPALHELAKYVPANLRWRFHSTPS